jgi:hypothetical protein
MANYINNAGGAISHGWDDIVRDPFTTGLNTLGGGIEYAGYHVTDTLAEGWNKADKKATIEADQAKGAMNDAIANLYTNRPTFTPPTIPEESGGSESITMPTYTPPIVAPKINKTASTYTPKRTTTILTKPGDISSGGKGKKTLLGQ